MSHRLLITNHPELRSRVSQITASAGGRNGSLQGWALQKENMISLIGAEWMKVNRKFRLPTRVSMRVRAAGMDSSA